MQQRNEKTGAHRDRQRPYTRLKPCPFCGGLPVCLVIPWAYGAVAVRIECSVCRCGTAPQLYGTATPAWERGEWEPLTLDQARSIAAHAWNSRL